jgi:uncharacterized protein (TIGR03083 family)
MIEFRSVPDGKLPDGQAARGRWLTDGASRLVRALRDAGDAEVWVFHGLAPAGFWARRMAHETLVHRADAELAAGDEPAIAPGLAADAIDEWLTVVTAPADGAADPRARALPPGRILHVHATDHGLGEAGEWLISHAAEGVTVRPGHGKGDAALSGPAADLLLVLLGRKPSGRTAAQVFGDSALLDQWLAQTPF